MDYERWILEQLLEKYEKSKAYATDIFVKRISIDVKKEHRIQAILEQIDEKRVFLSVLDTLKEEGIIDYSWVKYEEGNLIDRIWLIPEKDAIAKCYRKAERIPAKEKAAILAELLKTYSEKIDRTTALFSFFREMQEEICKKKRIPQFFTENAGLNEDIVKSLVYMENNQDEQLERILSSQLYGDSKYFERNVKARALKILRYMKTKEEEDAVGDEELLHEKGIVRWPEVLEFTGNILVRMKDGDIIDFRTQKYGAYINSDTLKMVDEVMLENVKQIIWIENKANYVWYVSHMKTEHDLVLYHGGCYSPVKGRWFQNVYAGSRKQQGEVNYFHWSDIDIGGFHIFSRLKKNIVPELMPYKMDKETLEKYRDSAMEIKSQTYLKTLENMAGNCEYREFHQVIREMLDGRIRLEQEQIITNM